MTDSLLDDILSRLDGLSEEEKHAALDEATKGFECPVWIPSPGPQTDAYYSEADVLLFGGSPGGGKTALGIGLGLTQHHRTLIVRPSFSELEGIIDGAKRMLDTSVGFVGGSRPKYKKPDGGVIHFAGVDSDGGIGGHQGVDHDLLYVDETTKFPESQIRLLIGWVRTDRKGQRCRVVFGSNPPMDSTGDWLIGYFAPWLDEKHPNPAKAGELRYFLPHPDGGDYECEKDDTTIVAGVEVKAQSRTFIPSKFTDNPYYSPEDYAKSLAGLPEDVRERFISGNFMLGREDDLWQTIPTAWVKAAQQRWKEGQRPDIPMSIIGVDVAQGGRDKTILAPRYDGWFEPLVVIAGKETPDGSSVAGAVIKHRRDACKVIIDMGGGYGGRAYDRLKDNGVDVLSYKGALGSTARTVDRHHGFSNKRSEAIWKFREALDPGQAGGSPIMLPDDQELLSDLTSPTYKIGKVIEVESKKDVCKRLRRSTDKGDAVIMAWSAGDKMADGYQKWNRNTQMQRTAILGRESRRRRSR